MNPPVLIIFFNRRECLSQVLQRARESRPRAVYLASDGARAHATGEATTVSDCRSMAQSAGWDCPVRTRFLASNEGCGRAVAGAIDWFFRHEPSGIILEDDCVPHPSFFSFCSTLLDRYADDERVMSISGTRLVPPRPADPQCCSYSFCRQPAVWGWASWSRAWRRYSRTISARDVALLTPSQFPTRRHVGRVLWRRKLRRVARGSVDTWDYQWVLAHLKHDGLTVIPRINLVTNVHTGSGAHSGPSAGPFQDLPSSAMDDPVVHPTAIEHDETLDRMIEIIASNHRFWPMRKLWKFLQRYELVDREVVRSGRLPTSLGLARGLRRGMASMPPGEDSADHRAGS
ncbi:MAG: hypothetical protein ACKOV8_03410 [Phycisphaerales bacterium]